MSAIFKRGNAEIEANMTPMIDVAFLLIVFFVLVSQIVETENVQMQLPQPREAMTDRPGDESRAVVNLVPAAGGRIAAYRLGAREFSPDAEGLAALSDRLAELYASNPSLAVNLRADRATHYEWIDPVMQAITAAASRRAGEASRIRLNLVVSREDHR
ncbi:MAG TPA: biopolymer transporter ExbD [Phycisphaerales bacterium]|nr:biopolymer transporter ExbD [Phycisphaerales bacterium]HRQ75768.1 biopolymer transporter ExbD [Phycisphaerales bacterium]